MGSAFVYALPEEKIPQSAFDRYMERVCSATGILKAEVLGHGRRYETVNLRHLLMCVARHEYGFTTTTVAEIFNRNHSSCIHVTQKMKNILGNDITLKQHPHLQECLCIADEEFNQEWGHYFKELKTWLIQKK